MSPAQCRACRCTHILPSRLIARTVCHDERMHVHCVRTGTTFGNFNRLGEGQYVLVGVHSLHTCCAKSVPDGGSDRRPMPITVERHQNMPPSMGANVPTAKYALFL